VGDTACINLATNDLLRVERRNCVILAGTGAGNARSRDQNVRPCVARFNVADEWSSRAAHGIRRLIQIDPVHRSHVPDRRKSGRTPHGAGWRLPWPSQLGQCD